MMDRLRRALRACLWALLLPVQVFRAIARVDRWDWLLAASSASLGWGVWEQWGAPWTAMLWGVLGLAIAGLHAVRSRPGRA